MHRLSVMMLLLLILMSPLLHNLRMLSVSRARDAFKNVARLSDFVVEHNYVLMIRRPAGRFLTNPFPPALSVARFLAAVIRPPRLFFAINAFTSIDS
jgi:hypothetical protein